MNIIYVITGLGVGGAENQLCQLADKFCDLGHRVTIISLMSTENEIYPKNKKIRIISLNMKRTPVSLILCLIKTSKIIKAIKPDIIHSHMFHANIFSRLLRVFCNIPVLITTAHSSNEGGELRMFLYRITDRLSTISTNVSQEAVSSFISKKATKLGRMIPLYNGIDTDKFFYDESLRREKRQEINIDENTLMILAVGRLTEAKDYPNLLTAFSKIDRSIKTKLVIVGDGQEKEKLQQLARDLNISHNVIWLGLRHDVQGWMCAGDIFVLSSAWEGFGLVVAEAMACERLVIGTNAGGVQEVIHQFGLVVPIRDDAALTKAINSYVSLTKQEKNMLQKNARQHVVDNFSLDKICLKWISLYKKLAK